MMPRHARTALALTLAVLAAGLLPAGPARAVVEVDITEGVVEPLPIAVSEFHGETAAGQNLGRELADVVSADLERSGLFRPLDRRAFIQSPAELIDMPRFADWRQINAEALVTGAVLGGEGGADLTVEFRLWDVFAGSQMQGLRFSAPAAQWRRVAHKIADAIYSRLTGEDGYFDSEIVYVSETGPTTDRIKRLAIMDQDGANHRFLTDGGDLVVTPRFHPGGNSLAFMVFRTPTPQVYKLDLLTERQARLGDFGGMTFAPHFAPDGRWLAMSQAENGNSDLYLLDLDTGQKRRLTDHPAIDTSPSFSPDSQQIVFNSDRAGSPQLYVMGRDGGNVQRISFETGNYGSPAWSPRGDLIAFTKITRGKFHVGVMKTDGSDERLLTESDLDEGPTWSPNGRVILFSRKDYRTNHMRLFTIDVTGYNERELPTPLDASDPNWSPLRP
jgi:TolB protein